jgi:putative tricarboxylic transport membrane protein
LVRLVVQKATGAKWVFVSFPSGGERIANLLGGHVEAMVIEPQEAGEHIRAGNMRVIAALTDKRLPSFPNVPTLKEQGVNVPVIPQARGILAPPGVPKEVVQYWEGIFDRFAKILKLMGEAGSYALILEKNQSGILYAPDSFDLTSELVRQYNDGKGK